MEDSAVCQRTSLENLARPENLMVRFHYPLLIKQQKKRYSAMGLLEELTNPHSVTEILERFSGEEIQYSPIYNNPCYHLTPNEMIALRTTELTAFRRYGFLRGVKTGHVYAKVESITLDVSNGLDLNNNIPLGKILKPCDYTRKNLYAKEVHEYDEAGNDIAFRITAMLFINEAPISIVREWIYGQ
jgi:hypothetical protein